MIKTVFFYYTSFVRSKSIVFPIINNSAQIETNYGVIVNKIGIKNNPHNYKYNYNYKQSELYYYN